MANLHIKNSVEDVKKNETLNGDLWARNEYHQTKGTTECWHGQNYSSKYVDKIKWDNLHHSWWSLITSVPVVWHMG